MSKTKFIADVNNVFKERYGIRYSEMLSMAPSIDYGTQKLMAAYSRGMRPDRFASLIGDNIELIELQENSTPFYALGVTNLNLATLALVEMARDPNTDFILSKGQPLRAVCERDGTLFSVKPDVSRSGDSMFNVEVCTDKDIDIRAMPFEVDGMLPNINETLFAPVARTSDIRFAMETIENHAQMLQNTQSIDVMAM